ncbi:MAG: hypothetical protein FWC43_13150, partial [Planctomycetaceae bacterium]|nr:hypothetical protein [Planctomycetaceae bacterium]
PGAQRSGATGPNRGEIRSLRCAPFPAAIIIGELVIDLPKRLSNLALPLFFQRISFTFLAVTTSIARLFTEVQVDHV